MGKENERETIEENRGNGGKGDVIRREQEGAVECEGKEKRRDRQEKKNEGDNEEGQDKDRLVRTVARAEGVSKSIISYCTPL